MKTTKSILKLALIPAVLGFAGSASAQLREAWAVQYTNGYARAAIVDSNGNIYITGSSAYDVETVKFDANGNLVWAASYSGHRGYGDGGYGIALDSAGNVYVTGAVTGNRFY